LPPPPTLVPYTTLFRSLSPDVVLMDVQMPVLDGIEATRLLADQTRIVILTTFDRDDYLFDALAAGASGFLLKNADPADLVDAVRDRKSTRLNSSHVKIS